MQNDKKCLKFDENGPPGCAYARGRPTWALRVTWRPRVPRW